MTPSEAATLFLGVDVGTYETKGVLVDGDGAVVARARHPHRLSTPAPGRAEHDADAVWWAGFVAVTRELLTDRDPESIAAIGCSAIGPCVLPLDAELRPLRPAILYGVDTRATAQIEELTERLGEEALLARSGNLLTSQSAGPKIMWIRDNEPEIYAATRYMVTSQSYLVARLTDEVTIDHGTAGYFHPLYNLADQAWDVGGCDDVITEDRLPRLGWATDIAGQVTAAAARATGLAEGTPVIFGTTDAPAEAVSSSVLSAGDLMLMYGSSTYMVQMLDRPVIDSVLWSAPYVFENSYVLAAGTSTAGTLTHWIAEVLGITARHDDPQGVFGELLELATDSPAGANGLLALPYFSGERTPVHDPDARGILAGLTLTHTRSDIARAIMEGVGHSVADALGAYAAAGQPPRRILAVGGGTKNPIFLQTVSDVTGLPQLVATGDGAALGDAALAALGVGHLSAPADIAAWCNTRAGVEPSPETRGVLGAAHDDFRELYAVTKRLMHNRAGRTRA